MALKCGSLPRDARDLVGLNYVIVSMVNRDSFIHSFILIPQRHGQTDRRLAVAIAYCDLHRPVALRDKNFRAYVMQTVTEIPNRL